MDPRPSTDPTADRVTRAFEIRSELARWLAQRGVAAVAEIVGDSGTPAVKVRPLGPDGSPDPGSREATFPVGAATVDDQVRVVEAELSRRGWLRGRSPPVPPPPSDLWCAPA
ncbi:MAG: hypothetical protein ACREDK_09135 [Thermoplasmata archaeon]